MRRQRNERGAIAMFVAVLSVVLFVSAALAVDLGNAWSRKRDVQKQVDVAALGAGWLLPMTDANRDQIADEVASRLVDNLSVGQDAAITGAQLLNDDVEDGELYFETEDGEECTEGCAQMRVVAPEATVRTGFAQLVGTSRIDVQREATVRVTGELPSMFDMLPFWLPSGCALGPAQADTTGGTSGPSSSSPTPSPTTSPTPSPTTSPTGSPSTGPSVPVGTHVLGGPSPVSVLQGGTRTVSGLTITGHASNIDRASIRFYSPNGSYFIDYAAQDLKKPGTLLTVPEFTVSSEVSSTPGDWSVYALIAKNKVVEISTNHLVFRVLGGSSPSPTETGSATPTPTPTPTPSPTATSIPVGCVGQDRGNFGQLDSPRKDMGSGTTNKRLAMNIAEGLDHQLVPFVWAEGQDKVKSCGKAGRYIDNAAPDDQPVDGRNCIQGDTGNDGPAIFDGLIAGTDGHTGRLSVSRPDGATTCPGRTDVVIGSSTINNDVLSCFLRNGTSLNDIAQSEGVDDSMLDPSVVKSPRFVWLPVVYATDRAQKDFQPIQGFVPGFITDETQVSTQTSSNASSDNGLVISGNSVKILQVFCFSKDALPLDSRSPTTTYGPELRSIVRLVR